MKKKLKASKAAGPDGIKANIVKFLIADNDKALLKLTNKILNSNTLPTDWANSYLVMIPKNTQV